MGIAQRVAVGDYCGAGAALRAGSDNHEVCWGLVHGVDVLGHGHMTRHGQGPFWSRPWPATATKKLQKTQSPLLIECDPVLPDFRRIAVTMGYQLSAALSAYRGYHGPPIISN